MMKQVFNQLSFLKVIRNFVIILLVLVSNKIHSQIITYTNGSGSYTIPAGVTSVAVQVWGAGGAGEGRTANGTGTGGGGGGYTTKTFNVAAGQTITYSVASGAIGTTGIVANVLSQTTASHSQSSTNLVANIGGNGSSITAGTGGLGGTATGGTTNTTGNNGVNTGVGGAGANGGAGGIAAANNRNGLVGTAPGGGGSGAKKVSGTANYNGGNGGNGRIIITCNPTITALSTSSGCVGSTLTITGNNFVGITAADVTIGGTPVASITTSTQTSIVAVVGSGTTGTVSVTTIAGTGTSATTFTVNPLPTTPVIVSPTTATSMCSGAGTSINLNATSAGNTIYWYTVANGGTSIGNTASGVNLSVTPTATRTYYAEARNASGCISSRVATATVTVTTPTAVQIQFTQFANDKNLTINSPCVIAGGGGQNDLDIFSGNPGGTATYQWQVSFDNGATWVNGLGPTSTTTQYVLDPAYTIYTTTIGVYKFRLIITNNGCAVVSDVITLTNNSVPNLTAGTISGTQSYCPPTKPTTFTQTAPTGGLVPANYSYQWEQSPNGNSGWVNAIGGTGATTATYAAPLLSTTTFYRRVVDSGTCSAISNTIAVYIAGPIVSISNTPVACASSSAQTATLNYSVTSGLPTSYSITWNTIPANSFVAVSNATLSSSITLNIPAGTAIGTYTGNITVKNSAGCVSASVPFSINVVSSPSLPIASTTVPTCSIPSGTIAVTVQNANDTYSFDNGVTFQANAIKSGIAVGSYNVIVKNALGCNSPAATYVIAPQATSTWNGTSWSPSAPTSNDKIIFNGNYTSSSNIVGCSCQVLSGEVVINSGNTMTLANELVVSGGTLTFEDKASLVQTNSNFINTGNIKFERETTPLKQYDYTYWSSPVTNASLSQLATNAAFYSFDPNSNNWVGQGGATTMTPGSGYIGRSPNNLNYSPTQVVETTFIGVPNNGDVTASILKSVSTSNLIGNPYPSAIDADLFITDAANSNNINGTIYLWTHNTALTNNSFTQNDYAKYNLIGGVKTTSSALSGGTTPTGKIAAGQGFFVEANSSLANGTYSVTFKNSMRVANNNNQFFKSNQSNAVAIEKHRFWVSLSTPQGAYNEFLIGYVEGATNTFDPLFDGRTLAAGNSVSIYSLLGNDNLAIQGRSLPFSTSDIIPIGYTTSLTGQLTINLENFDGLFDSQNVYLFDNTTGIYHDLKSSVYTFTTASGTFNNRFELRFNAPALNNNVNSNSENKITILTVQDQLVISSKNNTISKVEIYDVLGKLLFAKNEVASNEFKTTINNVSSQLLIVKVTLDNQQTFTKKISLK